MKAAQGQWYTDTYATAFVTYDRKSKIQKLLDLNNVVQYVLENTFCITRSLRHMVKRFRHHQDGTPGNPDKPKQSDQSDKEAMLEVRRIHAAFKEMVGFTPSRHFKDPTKLVGETIYPDNKLASQEYSLASTARFQLQKAMNKQYGDEVAERSIYEALQLIHKLDSDVTALRLTHDLLEVCRLRNVILTLAEEESGQEWEIDEDIFLQLREKNLSPKEHLKYLGYLQIQAEHFGFSTKAIEEEVARVSA